MTKSLPSPELLRKLLRYDPDTGKLFWRVRVSRWRVRVQIGLMFFDSDKAYKTEESAIRAAGRLRAKLEKETI